MTDRISGQRRSYNMRRIRSIDTSPEIAVRGMAYHAGFRYRLNRKELPGRPDLSFLSRRKIVFVHGCFWHQHPSAKCADSRLPESNSDYWTPKLQRNIERDAKNQRMLEEDGWQVLVLWECEIESQPKQTEKTLVEFLS